MQETTIEDIRDIALGLHAAGSSWHFHILTLGCVLNKGDRCVFVLEDVASGKTYAYYSDEPEKGLGQELLPLLHGKKVLDQEDNADDYQPSAAVQKIVSRAKEMNAQGIRWHHHVLFPSCTFNEHSGRWTLLLEDPATASVLENNTDEEPVRDLSFIEPLFYARKV